MNYILRFIKPVLCIVLFSHTIFATTYNISRVKVAGNERIDVEAIKAYIAYDKGNRITDEGINTTLSKLYESGYFKDVKISTKAKYS